MSGTKKYTQPLLLACLLLFGTAAFAQDVPSDYQEVLRSLDRKGDFKDGVLKVNIPRSDLKILYGSGGFCACSGQSHFWMLSLSRSHWLKKVTTAIICLPTYSGS